MATIDRRAPADAPSTLLALEHHRATLRGDVPMVSSKSATRLGPCFVAMMAFWRHQDSKVAAAARFAAVTQAVILLAVTAITTSPRELGDGPLRLWLVVATWLVASAVLHRCGRALERSAELRDLCQNDLWRLSTLLAREDEFSPFETWRRGKQLPETDAILGLIRLSVVLNAAVAVGWGVAAAWPRFAIMPAILDSITHNRSAQVGTIVAAPLALAQLFRLVEWTSQPFARRAAVPRWRAGVSMPAATETPSGEHHATPPEPAAPADGWVAANDPPTRSRWPLEPAAS
ncbi:MAG: hypothetical protein B7733_19930 [Myxococcales bacterium FL481]|nr:MAG: hypothetical protein B7733_19930 [Myxococcales bacterium FL481]